MKTKRVLLPLFAAAAVLVGMTACKPPAKEDKPPVPKAIGMLPKIGVAPKWSLKDLEGKVVSSDSLKGKVVVLDFWATWCPPCRAEIPGYVELQKQYGKDGLVIVGASADEAGPAVVKEFAAKMGINYTMLMADEAISSAFGGVEALPTTFLIDRNGQIRDRKVGMEEKAEYEQKIVAVLKENAS
ncbi:MAG TPA: redoxin domain-containing protein [Opitutaceae bacterium]